MLMDPKFNKFLAAKWYALWRLFNALLFKITYLLMPYVNIQHFLHLWLLIRHFFCNKHLFEFRF